MSPTRHTTGFFQSCSVSQENELQLLASEDERMKNEAELIYGYLKASCSQRTYSSATTSSEMGQSLAAR